jgi:hypothetical protein
LVGQVEYLSFLFPCLFFFSPAPFCCQSNLVRPADPEKSESLPQDLGRQRFAGTIVSNLCRQPSAFLGKLSMSTSKMKECKFCHEAVLEVAKKCRHCGKYLDGRSNVAGRDASTLDRMLTPVGRPVTAIAAGYLALFGFVPMFGLPFSIGALVCGLMALKTIKEDPELSGSGRAWFGIIAGSLMTLLGLLMIPVLVVFAPGRR